MSSIKRRPPRDKDSSNSDSSLTQSPKYDSSKPRAPKGRPRPKTDDYQVANSPLGRTLFKRGPKADEGEKPLRRSNGFKRSSGPSSGPSRRRPSSFKGHRGPYNNEEGQEAFEGQSRPSKREFSSNSPFKRPSFSRRDKPFALGAKREFRSGPSRFKDGLSDSLYSSLVAMAQDEFPIALKRLEEAKDSLRSAAEASLSSHDQFKSAIESSLDLLWPSLSEDSELTEDRAPGSPEHLINTQTRDKLTERLKSLSPIVLELSSLTASLDDLVGQRLSKIESFLLALSRLLIDFTDRPRARAGFNQPRERGYREAGDKSFNYRSNRPKYNESRSTDSRSNQSRSTDSKFNQSRSTDSRSNQSRSTDSRSGGPSRFKPYNRSLSEESKLRETREKRSRPKGSSQGRFEGDRFNGAKKGPGKGKKEAAASKKESALRGPDAEGFKQEEIDKLVDQLLKNKKK